MAVYNDSIQKILDAFPEELNPLHKYDNYTYHIQFYMVPYEYQVLYSSWRFNGTKPNPDGAKKSKANAEPLDTTSVNSQKAYEYIKDKKIIIAETGVTNDFSIDKLTLKSFPAFGTVDRKIYCATEEFQMTLKETAGISLVNYLHITSQLAGYDSYINTPYFLTITFNGYNNTDKGKAVADISKTPYMFTYQVIVEKVEMKYDMNVTEYTLTLRPITDVGLQKNNVYMMDTSIECGRQYEFGWICNEIIKKKNKEMKDLMGATLYNKIYSSSKQPIKLILKKPPRGDAKEDVLPYFDLNTDNTSHNYLDNVVNFYKSKVEGDRISEDSFQFTMDMVANNMVSESEGAFLKVVSPFFVNQMREKAGYSFFDDVFSYLAKGYNAVRDWMNKNYIEGIDEIVNGVSNIKGTIDRKYKIGGNGRTPLYKVFTDLFFTCYQLSGFIPIINIVPERIAEYDGETYYSITYVIEPICLPLLEKMQNAMYEGTMIENFLKPEAIESNQLQYITWLLMNDALLRKYTYNLSGKNTDVLSCETKDDNFWYLNSAQNFMNQMMNETRNTSDDKMAEKRLEFLTLKREALVSKTKKVINENQTRNKKNISMVDLIGNTSPEVLKELGISNILPMKIGSEAIVKLPKENSQGQGDKITENETDLQQKIRESNARIQITKMGAENMLSTGQRQEFRITILGDPYGLTFTSESLQIPRRSIPHIILSRKTFAKLNGWDNHIEEKTMEFTSLYRVENITSTFEGGEFKQELHGYIATPFAVGKQIDDDIFKDKDKVDDKAKTVTTDGKGTIQVIEAPLKQLDKNTSEAVKNYIKKNRAIASIPEPSSSKQTPQVKKGAPFKQNSVFINR